MAINKIIKLGLEEQANKLKAQGLSDYKIAEELTKIAGIKITRSTVYRYFNSNHDPVVQHVKQREEIVTKAINGRIDAVQQLIAINEETLRILKKAKESGDLKTALKAIERIEKQLELQAKLLGDIKEGPTAVVINVMKVDTHAD
ncbi:hypothetical protein DRP04_05600 [Archaeoglobales archaeon]|nr:MAG: hypothetical protein DRP04_05600 [Archaeoglobales archaeon]